MAKTSIDAARHFRGNYDHQNNFIRNVRDWYFALVRVERPDLDHDRREYYENLALRYKLYAGDWHAREKLELLHVQYRRGVLSGWLACDYPEFEVRVFGREPRRYYEYRRRRRHTSDPHGPYRQGRKYRKNTDHKPKARVPDSRSDWRAAKGFTRDKTRHGYWFSGSRCRDRAKSLQNRRRRHLDRMRIAKGKWDDFVTPKVDKWMWD